MSTILDLSHEKLAPAQVTLGCERYRRAAELIPDILESLEGYEFIHGQAVLFP